jgi:hypothetical protein
LRIAGEAAQQVGGAGAAIVDYLRDIITKQDPALLAALVLIGAIGIRPGLGAVQGK